MQFYGMFLELKDLVTAQAFKVCLLYVLYFMIPACTVPETLIFRSMI